MPGNNNKRGRPRIGPPFEFHLGPVDKERIRLLAEILESDMAPIVREAISIGLNAIEKRVGV
jgi:hypothetical protein